MASDALEEWRSVRTGRLDELLAAHRAVGGTGPGRRYRTEQLNRSFVLVLVGEFQGFARRLHDLAVDIFAEAIGESDPALTAVTSRLLTRHRDLDRRNPSPAALTSDFGRFGLDLDSALASQDARSSLRLDALDTAVRLRNAIAHADEGRLEGLARQGHRARKRDVVGYRSKLNGLAEDLDAVVAGHLATLFEISRPW